MLRTRAVLDKQGDLRHALSACATESVPAGQTARATLLVTIHFHHRPYCRSPCQPAADIFDRDDATQRVIATQDFFPTHGLRSGQMSCTHPSKHRYVYVHTDIHTYIKIDVTETRPVVYGHLRTLNLGTAAQRRATPPFHLLICWPLVPLWLGLEWSLGERYRGINVVSVPMKITTPLPWSCQQRALHHKRSLRR